jgi:hypothetical protein
MKIALDALSLLLGRRHHNLAARRERLDAFYECGFSASKKPERQLHFSPSQGSDRCGAHQAKPGQQEDHPDNQPGQVGPGLGHPTADPNLQAPVGPPERDRHGYGNRDSEDGDESRKFCAETIGRASQ